MAEILRFTKDEKTESVRIIRYLRDVLGESLMPDDEKNLRQFIKTAIDENRIRERRIRTQSDIAKHSDSRN